ncbi:uncharacterized protein LOC144507521 [Mustelus asterias]
MESGYYSEMENLGSAPLCLSEALSPYHEGVPQRHRTAKGRPGSSGRRKREFISDEKKDASYWEKRRKNNEAAKRSREKRRISDMVLENRVLALNEENVRLKSELLALKLRFGLITAAAYTEKSHQLAGASVNSYYSSYANSPGLLLNSDSSEAEHSSRGSGFLPASRYSPRGSLSDYSDGSSSVGDSPEPAAVPGDVKRDEDPAVACGGGEVASLPGSCDEVELVNCKQPVRFNLAPRDILQYGGQGGGLEARGQPVQPEDFQTCPAPQPSQTAPTSHGVGYTQLLRHAIPAKSLPATGLREPPSSLGLPPQYPRELSGTEAQRGHGHSLPKESVIEVLKRPPFENPAAIGSFCVSGAPRSLPFASKDEELEDPSSQNPDRQFPPRSSGFPAERREASECPFAPRSVIEAPRVTEPAAVTHAADKLGALSEGSDSESQEKADSPGQDAALLSGGPQEVRRAALPHKLRLKVRAMAASEQQGSGQDHPQQVSDPGRQKRDGLFHQHPALGECVTKNYLPVAGQGDHWGKSGLLDMNALPCLSGGLNDFEQYVPLGTDVPRKHQSAPAASGLHAVKVACLKVLERNTVQSAEKLSLHERNQLVSPTEG